MSEAQIGEGINVRNDTKMETITTMGKSSTSKIKSESKERLGTDYFTSKTQSKSNDNKPHPDTSVEITVKNTGDQQKPGGHTSNQSKNDASTRYSQGPVSKNGSIHQHYEAALQRGRFWSNNNPNDNAVALQPRAPSVASDVGGRELMVGQVHGHTSPTHHHVRIFSSKPVCLT